jgi:uncharacterized membrane protein
MRRALLIACALGVALATAGTVAADEGGFTIEDFDVDVLIRADATVLVSEHITVDFSEPRHGLYRLIPVRYTDPAGYQYELGFHLLEVTDENGRAYGVKETSQGATRNIRIGSADKLVRGRVIYNIRYRLDDALRSFDPDDEFYWNVTGNQWNTTIRTASATIHLPAKVSDADLKTVGYTGVYGSREQAVAFDRPGPDSVRVRATRQLAADEGLTVAVRWPQGLVHYPGPAVRTARFVSRNLIVLAPLLVLGLLWRQWRRRGRDPAGPGSVVVRYEPPEGLRPGELGTIADEKVDFRDLTATLVDLAVQGHLRIEVSEEKHLFGLISNEKIVFHRLHPEGATPLRDYETLVLEGIFYDGSDRMEASDLAQRFYKTIPKVKTALYSELAERGYFTGSPERVRAKYLALGFVAAIAVAGAGALWARLLGGVFPQSLILPIASAGITLGLFAVFSRWMPRRTAKGVEIRAWSLGFEEFVDRVESDQIEADRRRHVFESLLPYAMALGVAEKWARQFEGIYAAGEGPGWYVGNRPMHSGLSTTNFQRSLQHSIDTAGRSLTAAPRSSSSSGFGGGGSSGGGGGGGGGGSW